MPNPVCPVCELEDDPELPGVHLCSGMRRLSKQEQRALEFDQATKEKLWAIMDDNDRARARAAVEAQRFIIG